MPDPEDFVEQDRKRFKNVYHRYQQGWSPGLAQILEHIFWGLSITSVIGMIATMYWVGSDKPISGGQWLGLGGMGIVVFGLLAMLVRWVRHNFSDADRTMSQRFERGR